MAERARRDRYDAPAAGAFGGIATLGIGQHIPDTYPFIKFLVVYGSPIFSLIYTSLVQRGFIWAAATKKRRDMDKSLQRVRRVRDEAAASIMTSPEHLQDLQRTVESTEKLVSKMATVSDVVVVEMFTDISISDLMSKATTALQEVTEIAAHQVVGAEDEAERSAENNAPEEPPRASSQPARHVPPTAAATAAAKEPQKRRQRVKPPKS